MESNNDDESLFFTTSDLLKTINNVIKETAGDEAGETNDAGAGQGFELQRRMPDGSTRKADESDIALADFQSKMKQTADKIANLSPYEKLKWSNEQRQLGNKLYSKQKFAEAMDVYLTCLVAINVNEDNSNDNTQRSNIEHDWIEQTDKEIKLPVLMNLSACTLKLGMHRKTCSFCDMALEVKGGNEQQKVYFRRGKSYMLLGMHKKAEIDFQHCLKLPQKDKTGDGGNNDEYMKKEIEAVQKEFLYLEKLKDAAEKNRVRHNKAMKIMLGGQATNRCTSSSNKSHMNTSDDNDRSAAGDEMHDSNDSKNSSLERPLYCNLNPDNTSPTREFSTLRPRKRSRTKKKSNETVEKNENEIGKDARNKQSYFIWYMQKIEFSLRKVLYWLGDEEAITRSFDEYDQKKM